MDQKSYCRNKSCKGMRGMFCGFCLGRRYGEDVAEALLNPVIYIFQYIFKAYIYLFIFAYYIKLWTCPPCLGRCNCSICRRDQGKDPTGQLAQVAKAKGYNSVYDLLRTIEKEPDSTNENPIDNCEPKNCNSVENNIELQNKDLVVFTSNQSNINNSNAKTLLVESNTNNKLEKLKSKKDDYCGIKNEEQCNSENYTVEPRETSEMVIDKLYKKFILST